MIIISFLGHETPLNPSSPSPHNFHLRRTFWWRPGLCLGMGGCKIFATRSTNLTAGGTWKPWWNQDRNLENLLLSKKRRIFSGEKPMLELLGGGVGWSSPKLKPEKKTDPGTFVLERFQIIPPFFFFTVLEGCLWTYSCLKSFIQNPMESQSIRRKQLALGVIESLKGSKLQGRLAKINIWMTEKRMHAT